MGQNNSTFRATVRPDNILVFTVGDTSVDTVRDWDRIVTHYLDEETHLRCHMYDMRQLKGVSIFAVKTAIRLKNHPQVDNCYVAVVTNNSIVQEMVNTVLSVQPGGMFRIFTEEVEAITWLNQQKIADNQ